MKSLWRTVFGIGLILFGIVSLVLPVLPGAVIIFIGAELLGFEFLFWQRIKKRFFPSRFRKPDGEEDTTSNP
jgi:uncharacterized protein YqgC (DUF456 family)